jgi:hypothetical protein
MMTVGVGKVRFADWTSLEFPSGCSDTFIFQMSIKAGLPPADYARVIRKLVPAVRKLRTSASVWVQVRGDSGGGKWFIQAVRHALRGLGAPVAVAADSVRPQIWDFSVYPWLTCQPVPRPPSAKSYLDGKKFRPSELGCLRVLARANCAYTKEIASLTGLSVTAVRSALRTLEEGRYVQAMGERRRPFWRICRMGLSLALRSWGLPPGYAFPHRKERGRSACKERMTVRRKLKRASAGRHRRTARLWPAWLRRAWPQAEIWAGWTEVPCGYTRPDCLCWGILDGYETLFWLEVEGGNKSGQLLREKTRWRVNQALVYARGYQVRLAFTLLGPPWVRREVVKVFSDLPADIAVVLEDWKAFGELPVPAWGIVRWA